MENSIRKVSNMDKLPNEVLDMIFKWLPEPMLLTVVARVCRRWSEVVKGQALAVTCPSDLRCLHRRLVSVEVDMRIEPMPLFLNITSLFCPNIRYLTVNAANEFTEQNIIALKHLHHLTHLDIFLQSRVVDCFIVPLVLRLTSLVINDTVSELVLCYLCDNKKKFRALHMYGRALYFPPRDFRAAIRKHCFNLRELTLRCTELMDSAYIAISECRFLSSLQLYSCWLMTTTGAMAVTRLKRLRRLHITGARMVRENDLHRVIQRLTYEIEELSLSATNFTDTHVSELAMTLPALKVLELWRCQLSANSLLRLARELTKLQYLDTDQYMTDNDIFELLSHRTLTQLRCSLGEQRQSTYFIKRNRDLLRVRAADGRYEKRFIRTGGEGYRSSLYYFWTRDRVLEPLPPGAHPALDEDEEDVHPTFDEEHKSIFYND